MGLMTHCHTIKLEAKQRNIIARWKERSCFGLKDCKPHIHKTMQNKHELTGTPACGNQAIHWSVPWLWSGRSFWKHLKSKIWKSTGILSILLSGFWTNPHPFCHQHLRHLETPWPSQFEWFHYRRSGQRSAPPARSTANLSWRWPQHRAHDLPMSRSASSLS